MSASSVNPNAATVSSFSSQVILDSSNKTALRKAPAGSPAQPSTTYKAFVPFKDGSDALTGAFQRSSVLNSADNILTTLTDRIDKVEASVKKERPDIARKSWDFGVTDGKVVVLGDDLTQDEKSWLEKKLNSDNFLAVSAVGYVSVASSYLETTPSNPAYRSQNGATLKDIYYNFHDTKKSLEDGIGFRALISGLRATFDADHSGGRSVGSIGLYSGLHSFDYLAAEVLSAAPSVASS